MEAPFGQNRLKSFANRPKALVCYICGREFGTLSLAIHQKSCAKKWENAEAQKPKHLRRPLPQPPSDASAETSWAAIERRNDEAMKTFTTQALKACPYCQRTFLEDRLVIHHRSCTAEHPCKPVNRPNDEDREKNANAAPTVDAEPLPLVDCPICGRKFADDRIEKHRKICEKSQAKQRNVFSSASQRMVDPKMATSSVTSSKVDPEKWRREHEDFIEALKTVKRPIKTVANPGLEYVHCPHCERNFAPHVAERHIPLCENIRHKPKPPTRVSVDYTEEKDLNNRRKAETIRPKTAGTSRKQSENMESIATSVVCPECQQKIPVVDFYGHIQVCKKTTSSLKVPLDKKETRPESPQISSEMKQKVGVNRPQTANIAKRRTDSAAVSSLSAVCPECNQKIPTDAFYSHIEVCKLEKTPAKKVEKMVKIPIKSWPVPEETKEKPSPIRLQTAVPPKRQSDFAALSVDFTQCPECSQAILTAAFYSHIKICGSINNSEDKMREVAENPVEVSQPDQLQPAKLVTSTVVCPDCSEFIDVSEFYAHVQTCRRGKTAVSATEKVSGTEGNSREETGSAPVKHFCPMCGTKFLQEARFCANCGEKR